MVAPELRNPLSSAGSVQKRSSAAYREAALDSTANFAIQRCWAASYLLPLWEKVAQAKRAPDEGFLSVNSEKAFWEATPHPMSLCRPSSCPLPQGARAQ